MSTDSDNLSGPDTPTTSKSRLVPVSRPAPLQSFRVVAALMMREMTTTFGRSQLGYLWVVLEPIGGIAILAIGFSLIFRAPPIGDSFLLFYATGYLPFLLYNTVHGRLSSAIRQNRALLFYPAVTFVDVVAARLLLIVLTEAMVLVLVFSTLVIFTDTGARVAPLTIASSFVATLALGTGVGLINAALFDMLPSWQRIFQILSRPMFFLSGVFFIYDSLPEMAQDVLWWNPLLHAIGLMRKGFYPNYDGSYISVLYISLISFPLIAIGMALLRHTHREIIND